MNSQEPLMENTSEYWKIIDNLRDNNEKLEKELSRLRSAGFNAALPTNEDTLDQTVPNAHQNKSANNNFTLIVNHLNKVIYADKNGLKLWNANTPDMIPKVKFVSDSHNSSHERTKSTFLVLPEDQSIDVSVEELDLLSPISTSQDMLFLIKPVLHAKKSQIPDNSYKELVDHSRDLIFVVHQNRFLFVNKNALEVVGYTNEDLDQAGFKQFLVFEDFIKLETAINTIQTKGSAKEFFDAGVTTKDGKKLECEFSCCEVVFQEVKSILVVAHDMTSRKQTEEKLRKAKLEAEKINNMKSEFLSMMSHEIRTPMNGVLGMANLLLDTNLSSEQKDYVQVISKSGESLITIINDILDFTKVEAGKILLENTKFELRTVIEDILDLFSVKAIEKSLDLLYLIQPDVPYCLNGDVTRLRQILINLINNALKFTEKGEVLVSVDKIRSDGEDLELRFSVQDTGIGISQDKVDQLFEAFVQADSSITRRYGGTGLGLAISKRLVELMGGNIWLESEQGKGSTFYFTVKLKVENDTKPKLVVRGHIPELKNSKVLIVDDNQTNRHILKLQFDNWGMKPTTISSPLDALKLLENGETFDLGILDMQMPEMDGIQLGYKIKALPNGKDLPLIMLSSLGKIFAAPADVFKAEISKPIRFSELFDLVKTTIAENRKKAEEELEPNINKTLSDKLPLQILLAEDNLINQKLIIQLLNKMGYKPDTAVNGAEAIIMVGKKQYDILFMDIQMPVMDGLEATRTIVANWPKSSRPSIIAMTANVMNGDKEKCLEAGMVDYLAKPIKFHEVEQALMKWGSVLS